MVFPLRCETICPVNQVQVQTEPVHSRSIVSIGPLLRYKNKYKNLHRSTY